MMAPSLSRIKTFFLEYYFGECWGEMTDSGVDEVFARVLAIFEDMSEQGRLQTLQAMGDRTCRECGSLSLRQIEGETVCMSCAVVQNNGHSFQDFVSDYSLDQHSFPVCSLAFGKNLGSCLSKKSLFDILHQAPGGAADVGLRARFLTVMSAASDPPPIHRMLEVASELCREFAMTGEDALVFADQLGKALRKVGTAAILQKTNGQSIEMCHLAVSTFVYVWQLMERDRGIRNQISFELFFPGGKRGLHRVEPLKYRVGKDSWDFVFWTLNH